MKLSLRLYVRRNNKTFDWYFYYPYEGDCFCKSYIAPYHLKLKILDPDHELEIENPLKGYKGAAEMRKKYVPYFDALLKDCYEGLPMHQWVDITQRTGDRVLTQLSRDIMYCKSLPRGKKVQLLPFM